MQTFKDKNSTKGIFLRTDFERQLGTVSSENITKGWECRKKVTLNEKHLHVEVKNGTAYAEYRQVLR